MLHQLLQNQKGKNFTKTPNMGKRIYLTIIGLGLTLIGGLFMLLLGKSYLQARETRSWESAPAVILQSEIQERKIGEHVPTDYSAFILFGYEYEGKRLDSTSITIRGPKWVKEREKAEMDLKGYIAGETSTCYISPHPPHKAILKHDSKAAGYTIWFPTLFFI